MTSPDHYLPLQVKFCRVQSFQLGVSHNFVSSSSLSLSPSSRPLLVLSLLLTFSYYDTIAVLSLPPLSLLPLDLSSHSYPYSLPFPLLSSFSFLIPLQSENALPALLVYRGGELMGNLLRVTDSLGEDFTTNDLESFLQE